MPERTPGRRGPIIGIIAAVVLVAVVGIVFWIADPPAGARHGAGGTTAPRASDETGGPAAEPSGSAEPDAAGDPTASGAARPEPAAPPPPATVDAFDRGRFSIDDPMSIWVVVDKLRPLSPIDFEAPDLVEAPVPGYATMRQEAADAVVQLFAAAETEAGLYLRGDSAYRPFSSQQRIFDGDVAASGQEAAEQLTARPGYSEHQTGLTMDIGAASGACSLDACFADTPEGQWLAENAYRFGFLLRYPADKTGVTGFDFEPWHYRYIGVDLATELHDTGVTTLEEFFGLPPAPDYAD